MDPEQLSADHVLSLAQSMYPDELDALVVQLTTSPQAPAQHGNFPSATPTQDHHQHQGALAQLLPPEMERCRHESSASEHDAPYSPVTSLSQQDDVMTQLTCLDGSHHQGALTQLLPPEVDRCRHGSLSSVSEYDGPYSPVTPVTPLSQQDDAMAFSFEGSPPQSPSQWEDFRFRLDLELAETVLRCEAQGGDQGMCIKQEPAATDSDTDEPTNASSSIRIHVRDESRRVRRREQNRRAAKKCRLKKQAQHEALVQEYRRLESSNSELQKKLENLQTETGRLRDLLRAHMVTCTLNFTTTDQC